MALKDIKYKLDTEGGGPSKTYEIKKGDTLSEIAAENNTTVEELAELNDIEDVNKIYAGQTINLSVTGSSSQTESNSSSSKASSTAAKGFTNTPYTESDTVTQAYAALQQQLAAKPGAYQSQWQSQIDSIVESILNREDFSYDVNSDALYQQYKDQYTALGKLAMQDTMGQAAAMTGGYGNSYASAAGNQAYQSYLSQLNEVVPELYGMALDRYNQEGEELYNNYSLLADQENQDYSRYQDAYNQWLSELGYATDNYNNERSFDYSKYTDQRDFDYSDYRNTVADEQWQAQYDESVRQYNESLAEEKRQYNESMAFQKQQYEEAKASSGGSGGSSGGSGNSGSNDAALEHVASMSSAEIVETMQAYNYDEDNTGLAAFLDDCVASGRLTAEQADNYYAKYMVGGNEVIDTTVTPINKGGGASGSGGGGGSGSRFAYHYVYE